jgi:hypothetical protein
MVIEIRTSNSSTSNCGSTPPCWRGRGGDENIRFVVSDCRRADERGRLVFDL